MEHNGVDMSRQKKVTSRNGLVYETPSPQKCKSFANHKKNINMVQAGFRAKCKYVLHYVFNKQFVGERSLFVDRNLVDDCVTTKAVDEQQPS